MTSSPDPLEQKILLILEKYLTHSCQFSPAPSLKLAVGLSGGLDSFVLAEGLRKILSSEDRTHSDSHSVELTVLHYNHRWSDSETQDAQRVQQWAERHSLPFHLGISKSSGTESEGSARQKRWEFFQAIATEFSLSEVWLAHHANDQVETFLQQILRGAGPEGLTGIHSRRLIHQLPAVRPFLEIWKDELRELAFKWDLPFKDDPFNKDLKYQRNRIRDEVIPFLQEHSHPGLPKRLLQTVTLLNSENAHWESLLPDPLPERLATSFLEDKDEAWQRRLIRQWLKQHQVSDIGYDVIEQVRRLLTQREPAKMNLSEGRHCRRKAGELFIE